MARIVKVALYVLGLLIIVEFLLRIIGFEPFEIMTSDHKSRPVGVFHPDDSLGLKLSHGEFEISLRDEIFYLAKHDSAGRRFTGEIFDSVPSVHIHGCSYTYGWGVDDENTLTFKLNQKLKANVISKAVPSYGTVQPLIILRRLSQKDEIPDAVIYCFNDFHLERNIINRQWQRKIYLGLLNSKLNGYESSVIDNWAYLRAKPSSKKVKFVSRKVKGFYKMFPMRNYSSLINATETIYNGIEAKLSKSSAISVTEQMLVEMNSICKKHDSQFILATMSSNPLTKEISDFCHDKGIVTFSICPEDYYSNNVKYRLASWDGHPNEEAHQYFADVLAGRLINDFDY